MITMKTGSKTPAKFIFSDGLSETIITLYADDDSAAIAAKLQRVLELELEAGQSLLAGTPAALAAAQEFPELFDAVGAEERLTQAQPIGWGKLAAEELPEM